MNFLGDAVRALHENYRPVLFYMGLVALLKTGEGTLQRLVLDPIAETTSDSLMGVYLILTRILLVAGVAVGDTVFLSRIGREVDKPYWRVRDDREALRRFYRLWLLLGLTNLVYLQVTEQITGNDPEHPATFFVFLSYIVLVVLLHAFGTTVMFYGNVAREEVGEAFRTMSRHAQSIFGLCMLGVLAAFFLQVFYALIVFGEFALPIELGADALLAAMDGYISCFLFAYMWLVCRYDRDDYEHDREDFDL